MRSFIVVMFHPFCSNFSNFNEVIENSCIQNFGTVATIESLNKSILCWFSRLDISNFNSVFVTPIRKNRTCKLRSVIRSDCFGLTSFFFLLQSIPTNPSYASLRWKDQSRSKLILCCSHQ